MKAIKKKAAGAILKDRYENLISINSLKQQKVFSYRHACTYDRLGRFLLQYPQFILQLQWVSWADWFQKFGGEERLIKCLETELDDGSGDKSALWEQPLIPIEEVGVAVPEHIFMDESP